MTEENKTALANSYARGVLAAVLGTAAYLTGVSIENETLRGIMDYVVGAEYIEPFAARDGYIGMLKLVGGAAAFGGLAGIVTKAFINLFEKTLEKTPACPYGRPPK
ncbi:MAG: hypothetical protein QW666_04185 [Candidatus Woesearchaeota archaeon]